MGVEILLLVVVLAIGAGVFMVFGSGTQALRHRRGGDLGPRDSGDGRPTHRVAEPTDEHAAGFGVGGEHHRPKPARVPRD